MKNKKLLVISILAVILSVSCSVYRYDQYLLAWLANRKIDVAGIKLRMPEERVVAILGKDAEMLQGFGGYRLEYRGQGVFLTFLNDIDTDFYKRVNEITISNQTYAIFGIRIGDNYKDTLETLRSQGFYRTKPGYTGFWKRNLYIRVDNDGFGKVTGISIGIRDRISSTRVY